LSVEGGKTFKERLGYSFPKDLKVNKGSQNLFLFPSKEKRRLKGREIAISGLPIWLLLLALTSYVIGKLLRVQANSL